jgi:hypothetical protein
MTFLFPSHDQAQELSKSGEIEKTKPILEQMQDTIQKKRKKERHVNGEYYRDACAIFLEFDDNPPKDFYFSDDFPESSFLALRSFFLNPQLMTAT